MTIIHSDSPKAKTARMDDVLLSDYLALPRWAMQNVGPATQTLAAAMRMANNKLFTKVERLAEMAMLKTPTCRRHLDRLTSFGYLHRLGRKRRRTVTYEIPQHTKDIRRPYAVLPRWACLELPTWSQRAVFALLVSRHTLVEAVEGQGLGCAEDRRYYSIGQLARDSGLARNSVVAARSELEDRGLIELDEDEWVYLNLDRETRVPRAVKRSRKAARANPRSDRNIDWKSAEYDALRAGALLKPATRGDRWLILGAVYLKHTILSEDWFYDSLEATRLAVERGPLEHGHLAYWRGVLKSKCLAEGIAFDQELAKSKVPYRLLEDTFWEQIAIVF